MNRLPDNLENPIDNSIRKITDILAKYLTKYKFNPLIITSIGNVWTYFSLYYLRSKNFSRTVIFLILRLMTDYLYDSMTYQYYIPSRFGKWYQCWSNYLFIVILWTITFYEYGYKANRGDYIIWIMISLIALSLFVYNLYNIDRYKDTEKRKDYGYNLDRSFNNTRESVIQSLAISKYFSYSTIIIFTIILVYCFINDKCKLF